MYVKIIQLRAQGMRRKDIDIARDTGASGELHTYRASHCCVMHLYKWGIRSISQPDLLFPLYDPQVISGRDDKMLIRGFQRASMTEEEAAPTYLQEWKIEFLKDEPISDDRLPDYGHIGTPE